MPTLDCAMHFGYGVSSMENSGILKKLLTETRISANIFCRKRCYHKATVRLSYVVIKKAT